MSCSDTSPGPLISCGLFSRMQNLTFLLKYKEESLRKSQELLRKSQQGEESGETLELS